MVLIATGLATNKITKFPFVAQACNDPIASSGGDTAAPAGVLQLLRQTLGGSSSGDLSVGIRIPAIRTCCEESMIPPMTCIINVSIGPVGSFVYPRL